MVEVLEKVSCMIARMLTLYKLDTRGDIRIWFVERDIGSARYRVCSGLEEGKIIIGDWMVCEGKNIGRSNETSPEAQCYKQIESEYDHKLKRGYYKNRAYAAIGNANLIKPMLAEKFVPGKFQTFSVQPKLDGVRCIVSRAGMFSREGRPINSCPHILKDVYRHLMFSHDVEAIDGELYNHDFKDDFNKIVSMVKRTKNIDFEETEKLVQFHAYDVICKDNTIKFKDRHSKYLASRISLPPSIVIVDTVHDVIESDAKIIYANYVSQGYEGIMCRADAPYEHKRSKNLMKWKGFVDAEFEVVRFEEGLAGWSGMAKSVICRTADGREFGAGVKGSMEYCEELLHRKPLPKWATICYQNETPDGIPRFGIAKAFYDEKRDL